MEVICLEDAAYYALLNKTLEWVKTKHGEQPQKWLSDTDAMQLLNVKSKTTLQSLRDEGKIRFSQPQKKIILYDRASIEAYLEKHAHNNFK